MPLIYSSGPLAFDYVFDIGNPGGSQEFLRFAFLKGGGEFGWQTHRVAEFGGQVVAAGAGFDGRTVLRFTIASAHPDLAILWTHPGMGCHGARSAYRDDHPPAAG